METTPGMKPGTEVLQTTLQTKPATGAQPPSSGSVGFTPPTGSNPFGTVTATESPFGKPGDTNISRTVNPFNPGAPLVNPFAPTVGAPATEADSSASEVADPNAPLSDAEVVEHKAQLKAFFSKYKPSVVSVCVMAVMVVRLCSV